MDYTADSIGIRVSGDKCWLILKKDDEWKLLGEAQPLLALRQFTAGAPSGLDLALELMSWQNPSGRSALMALGNEHSSPR